MFCLPVPKDKFQTSTPWFICAIALLDALLLIPFYSSNQASFLRHYGLIPSQASAITIFTALFLHAGFFHYAGNMWFLWIFGKKVEHVLGTLRFAALYFGCGVGGQIVYLLFNLHSSVSLVGASGAISGIAGFYFLVFPKERFDLHLYFGWWKIKTIDATTRSAVGAWIGEQLVLALLTQFAQFSTVAFWAHVGGFAVGTATGFAYHRLVPESVRPIIPVITTELPPDTEEQPSELTTLKLN